MMDAFRQMEAATHALSSKYGIILPSQQASSHQIVKDLMFDDPINYVIASPKRRMFANNAPCRGTEKGVTGTAFEQVHLKIRIKPAISNRGAMAPIALRAPVATSEAPKVLKTSKKRAAVLSSKTPKSMLWYGSGMLRFGGPIPILRVYPSTDLFRMTNAQCEWINVPKLKGVIHDSINKAGQELRRVNLGLGTNNKRKTCNIWDHFTVDPEQTIKVKKLRDSTGFASHLT